MVQVLQRPVPPIQVNVPARVTDPNDMYDKFKKRNPTAFYENEDPLDADERVVQVEKIFQVFQCTNKEKVKLAAYLFKGGVAEMRWKSVKTPYDTITKTTKITEATAWTSFEKLFRTKYIPPHILSCSAITFLSSLFSFLGDG